jgi:hypothetical protein
MKKKYFFIFLFSLFFINKLSFASRVFELSLRGNYSKTNYGVGAYSTTKRYSISLGMNITPITEFEVGFMNEDSLYKNAEIQVVETREQSLYGSLVQTLVPPSFIFQPYIKGGAAQYNRKQTGRIYGVPTESIDTKSPSFLIGGGIRLYFTQHIAFRVEAISYMTNFKPSEAKNNFAVEVGVTLAY